MTNKSFSTEIGLYVLSAAFIAFTYTNFKPEVASGLLALLFISFMILVFDALFLDKKLSIPFINPSIKWSTAIIYGTVYGLLFIVIGSFYTGLSFFSTAKFVAQATMPSFAKSVFLTFLTWVVVIVFVESITSVRVHEFIANRLKINPLNLQNPVILIIIGIIGFSALLFHSSAYGVTNNKALILSFAFFASGVVLSIKFKEARPFVVGHGVVNGLAFAT